MNDTVYKYWFLFWIFLWIQTFRVKFELWLLTLLMPLRKFPQKKGSVHSLGKTMFYNIIGISRDMYESILVVILRTESVDRNDL